jgi:restriction system protein
MFPALYVLTKSVLEQISNGAPKPKSQIVDELANKFNLSPQERNQLKPSGGETLFGNRVRWAIFELDKGGLILYDKGILTITQEGKNVLNQNPDQLNRKFLLTLPKYAEYYQKIIGRKKESSQEREELEPVSDQSPEDMIIAGHRIIRRDIESSLLEKITNSSPQFFEQLVLELVRKMGYGIDHTVLGRTGDGGIDGVIKEDKLGLGEIYFQAKRWKGTVPIHQVRDFAGALMANKSKRGIFITSSDFSNDAYEFVKNIDSKIILITGEELCSLMYDYTLGVKVQDTYEIKKIDEDYFSE